MNPSDRRNFLKSSAVAVAGISAAGSLVDSAETTRSEIPPHRSIELPGLHSYAEKSIEAGDTIHFRTSSMVPYRLTVCRLSGPVDDRASDEVLHQFEASNPTPQPIHPGSYVHISKPLKDKPITSLSLECWVRPWRMDAYQGLITQHDYPKSAGLGLFINNEGRIECYFGTGGEYDKQRRFTGPKLNHRRWNHVVATLDQKTVTLWVHGRRAGSWELQGIVKPGSAPLRLAAYGENGVASHFLDGDLAMPIIYDRALSSDQIMRRIDARALTAPAKDELLACWPLAEENGEKIADSSEHRRHGRIINHATWMIGGPSFQADNVGRYDTAYKPSDDARRGHGLRFAADDLYDCRWRTTHEFQLPKDSKSGVYVGRFEYEIDNQPFRYDSTFIVRKAKDRPRARILMLCSSSTWLAYNAVPFPVPTNGPHNVGTGGLANSHPAAPAYSCYRDHHGSQPTYYLGMNLPWPIAAPDVLYSPPGVGYSHLMRGELFTHRWMDGLYGDGASYDYDVVTDLDLHQDPSLLQGYKALVINGHSEYWSAQAYQAVDEYLQAGGNAFVLSGNTMFWRTTFNQKGTVMECRKFDPRIGGRGGATIGELYHSDDQRRGSLMRECGYPAWQNIGLECCGWAGVDGVYEVEHADHELFHKPESTALAGGESFGHGQNGKFPKAVAHEWDVRLSTLKKNTRKVPPGAELPDDEPAGIETLARGVRSGGSTLDYFTAPVRSADNVCAEMIFWKRPTGGQVFHAGAIAAGWALSADPKLRTLFRNVLHRFGINPTEAVKSTN